MPVYYSSSVTTKLLALRESWTVHTLLRDRSLSRRLRSSPSAARGAAAGASEGPRRPENIRANRATSIQRRAEPLPFALYLKGPNEIHHDLLAEGAPWGSQGWCQVRSQGIQLAELNRGPSRVASATCIFCGSGIGGAEFHHVLAECLAWAQERAVITQHQGVNPGTLQVLDPRSASRYTGPGQSGWVGSQKLCCDHRRCRHRALGFERPMGLSATPI